MKCKLTVLLMLPFVMTNAQWSNTTNQFYDSLHSFVCKAPKDQSNSISLKSYPDSGYIVIWEDPRAGVLDQDIYAQKYDKNGVALWATDGVPVATGPDFQTFSNWSTYNTDYRNYGKACTDSAGGFYIAWEDYNVVATGVNGAHRVCVQHTKSDGTNVFPGIGKILAEPDPGIFNQFGQPQLIADGNKGFFVGYMESDDGSGLHGAYRNFYVKCFRDEAGILKYFGGGKMDPDKIPAQENIFPCGAFAQRDYIVDVDDRVQDFYIFPDGMNGCGIVWTFDRNAVTPNGGKFLVSNRLCRVKKNSHTICKRQVYPVNFNGTTITSDGQAFVETNYPKDSVVLLYQFAAYYFNHVNSCAMYSDHRYQILGEGYRIIEFSNWLPTLYTWNFPKGIIIPTDGNVDPIVYTIGLREYNGSLDGIITKAYIYETAEKYDSIPYQFTSDSLYLGYAFNPNVPPYLNKISHYIDTILEAGDNYHDFSIAAGNGRMVAAALIKNAAYNTLGSNIFLQEIKATRINADSFHIYTNTISKKGVLVAKEISTGFTGTDIYFEFPMVTMDKRGNALLYVAEVGKYVRVSPIGDSAKLLWGTGGGKPIGSALNQIRPFVNMNNDGTALLCWNDARNIAPGINTENNILMRHLDSLDSYSYTLPFKKLYTLDNGIKEAFPVVMVGNSNQWISFDMKNNANNWTEVVQVKDNFNLGYTYVQAYTNNNIYTPGIRTYNGKPYLDINYLIKPTNNPAGAAQVGVRLFFTQKEFVALKLADPSITSPADLVVIKQPGTNNVLDAYTPVAGEVIIQPTAWKAVDGGYYLEFPVSSFSNFFIFKGDGVLPVTWLNITAQKINSTQALVIWNVANEVNAKEYTVQISKDGIHFQDACIVLAVNKPEYQCTIDILQSNINYIRVQQKDIDGHSTTSKLIVLRDRAENKKYNLFPNPANTYCNLRSIGNDEMIEQLVLFNAAGGVVWKQGKPVVTASGIQIPLSLLPAGLYHLQITGTKTTQTIKLIKQ